MESMNFILQFDQDNACVTKIDPSFTGEMVFEKHFNNTKIQCISSLACQYGNLTSLDLRKTEILSIYGNAFLHSQIRTLYLPETLTFLGFNAFGLTNIEYVNITANVKEMDTCAWNQITTLKAFNVSTNNMYFSSINGFLFNKQGTILYGVPRSLENFKMIPNYSQLETIGKCAFTSSKLRNFIAPKTLKTIDEYSFHVTPKIKLINLKNTSITEIPTYAFRSTSAKYIIFPLSLQSLKEKSVSLAYNLRSLVIPSNVSSITESAIDECTLLSHVFYFGLFDHSNHDIFSQCNKLRQINPLANFM